MDIVGMIGGTAFAMFEGAVIAILREHKADYGLQRIYGSIGGMISSPLSGMLIDYASNLQGYPDFRYVLHILLLEFIVQNVITYKSIEEEREVVVVGIFILLQFSYVLLAEA
jgi:hypothetical protein